MEYYLSIAGAVMGALSLLLHAFGVRHPKVEKLADDVDAARDVLPKLDPK